MKKGIFLVLAMVIFIGCIKYMHIDEYLTINYLHEHIDELKQVVANYYWLSVGCYIGAYVCVTSVPFPGTSMFAFAGGLLFGPILGVIYAIIAATIGATMLFLASRYIIGVWVQRKFQEQLRGFNQEMQTLGHYYLLLVRLLAVLPFCVVNMLSGLTHISLKKYIYVTLVGIVPMSFIYVYAGNQLAVVQKIDDFFSPKAMTAFVALFLFKVALFPALIKIMMYARRVVRPKAIQA